MSDCSNAIIEKLIEKLRCKTKRAGARRGPEKSDKDYRSSPEAKKILELDKDDQVCAIHVLLDINYISFTPPKKKSWFYTPFEKIDYGCRVVVNTLLRRNLPFTEDDVFRILELVTNGKSSISLRNDEICIAIQIGCKFYKSRPPPNKVVKCPKIVLKEIAEDDDKKSEKIKTQIRNTISQEILNPVQSGEVWVDVVIETVSNSNRVRKSLLIELLGQCLNASGAKP